MYVTLCKDTEKITHLEFSFAALLFSIIVLYVCMYGCCLFLPVFRSIWQIGFR